VVSYNLGLFDNHGGTGVKDLKFLNNSKTVIAVNLHKAQLCCFQKSQRDAIMIKPCGKREPFL
jgi:hypothetical protein